ncbi:hypothetical protein M3Y97_00338700 [Aphelenchoides bicaudatus]|nr:hypothetical protein M3Y97_00338700 [Aphelenchoides bicaudatus]
MESFLSSSTNEIGISTPNRRDTQRLKIRLSPILGQKALFRQSEFSDHGFLSSQSTAATICRENYTERSTYTNCLEMSRVRNFGYVNLQTTKTLSIVIRNRYENVVMLGIKLSGPDSDVFKIINSEDENRCVESNREMVINVSFTPTSRKSYNRSLFVTVIPDRRSGLTMKRYEVYLVGHGGAVFLRISQNKSELPSARMRNANLAMRWNGQYDARMQPDRQSVLTLKNTGERVAFVYIKALNHEGEEVASRCLNVTPRYFLLNKLCYESKDIAIHVSDDRLWQQILSGGEVRLAIYSVVERQRIRLIEYSRLRNSVIDPIEEIDFTSFNFGTSESVMIDKSTVSSEDLRVFKEELRVNFVRLLPPSVLGQANENYETNENRYTLYPLQFEDNMVKQFDNDDETIFGTSGSSQKHKRGI